MSKSPAPGPSSKPLTTTASSSNFNAAIEKAIKEYEKKTKQYLIAHPFTARLQKSDSPEAFLVILQDQVDQFTQFRSRDERLQRWLGPTLKILYGITESLGEGISLVLSPKIIFVGAGVLFQAAKEVEASQDHLIDIFERIENLFRRLEVYTAVPPTPEMRNMIVKIIIEVLDIFGTATTEMKQSRAQTFLRKIAGTTKLEDGLKKLNKMTNEQARMANAEAIRLQNYFQVSEQKRLETELNEVEEGCQRQKRSIQELWTFRSNTQSHHHAPNLQLRSSSSSTPRPPGSNNPFIAPSRDITTSHATSSRSVGPASRPLGSNNPFAVLSRHTATSHATNSRSVDPLHDPRGNSPPPSDWDGSYATLVQDEFDREDRALTTERAALSRYATSHTTNPRAADPHDTHGGPSAHRDDGFWYAMRLQSQFDSEDHELSAEHINLLQTIQPVFECGICMEEMPEDSVAHPDPCGHAFCRECMRVYVSTNIKKHQFPILCPTCTADNGKGNGVTGEVSQSLALDLGLTDEQFNIWTEMEMVSFSVLLHCRKCQRSMFVARDEHDETKIIACPLPDCNNVWCKQCQQAIEFGGPQHSCDGTTELDHLMKQQGWKYCPSCKTPIQKVSGCNHMSCMTPACNTHFCYICGGLIVKSALGQEIKEATSNHYRTKCSLFEVPAET